MHWSVAYGHTEMVKYVCDTFPHLCSIETETGATLLHWAAANNRSEIVSLLLSEVDHSLLYYCVKHDCVETLQFLLLFLGESAFDTLKNWQNIDGQTLLHIGVIFQSYDCLYLLMGDSKPNPIDINAVDKVWSKIKAKNIYPGYSD